MVFSDRFICGERLSFKGTWNATIKSIEEQALSIGIKHVWLWTFGDEALKFYQRQAYHQFIEMENWYSYGSSRIGLRKKL